MRPVDRRAKHREALRPQTRVARRAREAWRHRPRSAHQNESPARNHRIALIAAKAFGEIVGQLRKRAVVEKKQGLIPA